jgi:competence protein ComEC
MTIAATLATAPLIAFHFEAFSTTALIANLLALPAVPPAMWLGMLAAAVGQVPGLPVEPLNSVNALLLAYVAQVAAWCGRPSWASLDLRLGAAELVASYLAIAAAAVLALRLGHRRRIAALRRRNAADGPETSPYPTFPAHRRRVPVVLGCLATVVLLWGASGGGADPGAPHSGLRVSILDVGQGDAILLQPARAPAVLVDTGPPAEGLAGKLADAGVDRLGAVVLTHDQSDHAGGLAEVLDAVVVDRLLFGAIGQHTLAQARAAGIPTRRLGRGEAMRTGRLSLEVLWPPVELLGGPLAAEDPNRLSLVVLARWRRFSMLLTGDAEAEAVPLDLGPVDVLKIAHHGSEDAGLGGLLDRTRPRLALISVGERNPFGHPAPATLATLAAHGVRAMRTDRDGVVVLDVDAQTLLVGSGE